MTKNEWHLYCDHLANQEFAELAGKFKPGDDVCKISDAWWKSHEADHPNEFSKWGWL